MKRLAVIGLALFALAGVATVSLRIARPFAWAEDAASTHGNALWHIVHELCTRDMRNSGNPAPCVSVDFAGGYAVLKDIQGRTQYLVIPTAKITGIESPELLLPTTPNYWAAAWKARTLVQDRIGHPVPREDLGLAVNSVNGRTQNQLHIHIDCVRRDVRDALRQAGDRIGPDWAMIDLGEFQHHFHARWLPGDDLGSRDPFKILNETDPVAHADMGKQTLALVGASRGGEPGFILLSDPGDGTPNDEAAAEELLDHSCKVAAGA